MMLADYWSMFSTCCRLHVGSAVVDRDFQVLVSAFNGSPRGLRHCDELSAAKDGHCLECIHSEVNCINQAARVGVSLRGALMFTLYRPCIRCSLSLAQVGLLQLRYRDDYDSDGMRHQALMTLESAGIEVIHQPASPIERDFNLLLSTHTKAWSLLAAGV